jgi:serine/threonine-protein kinase
VKSRPKAVAPAPLAQAAPALPAPPADGSVTLAIAPWGEIIVDGTSLGVSPPLTHLTLAAGAHTIEVHNGAATPFLSRIDVRPGQAVEVQHRF